VQAYLLHLVRDRQLGAPASPGSSAVRFLLCEVLGQTDRRDRIPMALTPQRLPEVLSRAEVAAVLAAPMSIKARTLLMTAYATGLLARCQIKIGDVNGCLAASRITQRCEASARGKRSKRLGQDFTTDRVDHMSAP